VAWKRPSRNSTKPAYSPAREATHSPDAGDAQLSGTAVHGPALVGVRGVVMAAVLLDGAN
jgi:hypothetical protein